MRKCCFRCQTDQRGSQVSILWLVLIKNIRFLPKMFSSCRSVKLLPSQGVSVPMFRYTCLLFHRSFFTQHHSLFAPTKFPIVAHSAYCAMTSSFVSDKQ